MKDFEKVFKRILVKEADNSLEDALSQDLNEVESEDKENNALSEELDDSLDSNDIASEADELLKGKIEKKIKQGNDQIATWADSLEDFANFINDATNKNSIRHIVDNSGSGSALAAVKAKAGKQMTRVATDCAVLAQTLKSLIGSVSVNDVIGGSNS